MYSTCRNAYACILMYVYVHHNHKMCVCIIHTHTTHTHARVNVWMHMQVQKHDTSNLQQAQPWTKMSQSQKRHKVRDIQKQPLLLINKCKVWVLTIGSLFIRIERLCGHDCVTQLMAADTATQIGLCPSRQLHVSCYFQYVFVYRHVSVYPRRRRNRACACSFCVCAFVCVWHTCSRLSIAACSPAPSSTAHRVSRKYACIPDISSAGLAHM